MMNIRPLVACLTVVCLSVGVSIAVARGPNQQGGPQRGGGGGPAGNLQAGGAANGNAQRGGGMGGNRMQQQNMPTIEQLAQAMLTQYDADGNSSLDQAELQSALTGLRQIMMQNQAAGNCPPQMGGDRQPNQNDMQGRGRGPGGPEGGRRGGPGGQAGRGGR